VNHLTRKCHTANFLKSIPPDQAPDSIYKMFDFLLLYKNDELHVAIRIFVEFHAQAFGLATTP
jgi:hypothetical protein